MEITIRQANENDLEAILEIVNYSILHTTANYNYDVQTLEIQTKWLQQKHEQNFPVIVATQDNEVIGFGTYGMFREKIGYQFTVEHSIYVAPHLIAKGIGKLLMSELIELAKKQKIHTMIGGIDASNTYSIDFHKKFGFTECGIIREAGFKFDRWLDLQFMQLLLK